jgi:hypothetical protein
MVRGLQSRRRLVLPRGEAKDDEEEEEEEEERGEKEMRA